MNWEGRQKVLSCIHEFHDTWWNVIYYLSKSIIEHHVKYNRHTYRFSINSYILSHGQVIVPPDFLPGQSFMASPGIPTTSISINSGPSYCTTRIGLAKGSGQTSVFFFLGLILWCNQSGNNPQKDLANSKYGNKIFRHPSIIFCLNHVKNMASFLLFFFNSGYWNFQIAPDFLFSTFNF